MSFQLHSDGKSKVSYSWGQVFSECNPALIFIFSRLQFSSVSVITNYLNFIFRLSVDLLAVFMFRFCPAFFRRDVNMYLSFLIVAFRPVSVPATSRAPLTYLLDPCQCIRHCIRVVTGLRAGRPRVWIPAGGKKFFFPPKTWGVFFIGGKATGARSWPLTSVRCRG